MICYKQHERVTDVVKQLATTGEYHDPLRSKLTETRKAVVLNWLQTAEALDQQGEIALAADVRHFTRHLPSVRTDNEASAAAFARHVEASRGNSVEHERKQSIVPSR